MSFGILLTGSCTLNEIALRQGEETKLKHTLKRFYSIPEYNGPAFSDQKEIAK